MLIKLIRQYTHPHLLFLPLVLSAIACSNEDKLQSGLLERTVTDTATILHQGVQEGEYATVLDRIEAGDKEFIEIVPFLKPHVQGQTAQALKLALSRALSKQPVLVLNLTSSEYKLEEICINPYVNAPLALQLTHAINTLEALNGLQQPDALQCRKSMQDMLKTLRH